MPDSSKSANYPSDSPRAIAPAVSSKAVAAPGTDIVEVGCTLFVGTLGDLCVDLRNDPPGTKTLFKGVVGAFPYRVKNLYGAGDGTTAEDIVAVW